MPLPALFVRFLRLCLSAGLLSGWVWAFSLMLSSCVRS
jgi:hypothetical protein